MLGSSRMGLESYVHTTSTVFIDPLNNYSSQIYLITFSKFCHSPLSTVITLIGFFLYIAQIF